MDGRKWWSTGAMAPECRILIVMGVTDPDAEPYRRQSMVLVPRDTPGVTVVAAAVRLRLRRRDARRARRGRLRPRPGAGVQPAARRGRRLPHRPGAARPGPDPPLHARDRRGRAGAGADVRAGPRPGSRSARRSPQQGVVQDWIAEARIRIEQARLLTLKAAWLMDTVGNKGARVEIAAIKVVAPQVARTGCWTRPSRCTAAAASPTTSRSPGWPPRSAPCASPTGRTRCTRPRSPAASSAPYVPRG